MNDDAMNDAAVAIAVAVVEHDGRFLIGRRPEGVALAGLWEFPGGKIQADETPQQAAARECLEETGLAVRVGAAYPQVLHRYDHGLLRLDFFAATPVDAGQQPAEPFRWVARKELGGYDFPPANEALVRQLVGGAGDGDQAPGRR